MLLALFALLALAPPASAATASGRVTYRNGTGFPGAKVELFSRNSSSGVVSWYWRSYTDGNGNWTADIALSGNPSVHYYYEVRVSADYLGFTQPAQLDVTTTAPQNIPSIMLGDFSGQLGSRVVGETPGRVHWLQVGDGNWWTDAVGGFDLGSSGGLSIVGGRVGRALTFNGTSHFGTITAAPLAPNWTLSFWARREDGVGASTALLGDAATGIKIEQFGTARSLGLTRFGIADYSFNYTLPAGQWVHVTMLGLANQTKLYINGVYQSVINVGLNLPRQYVGRRDGAASGLDWLKGTYEEIAIFNRTLRDTEIFALYSRSALGSITGRITTPGGTPVPGVQVSLGLAGLLNSVDQIPAGLFSPIGGTQPNLNWIDLQYGPLWSGGPNNYFGAVFKGIAQFVQFGSGYNGRQHHWLYSDDGSRIYTDGQLIIDNDGNHGSTQPEADSFLRLGAHDIEVRFFNGIAPWTLRAYWQGFDGTPFAGTPITPNYFGGFSASYYDFNRLAATTTDANGYYTFNNVPGAQPFRITPAALDYGFNLAPKDVPTGTAADFSLVSSKPTITDAGNQSMLEDTSLTVGFSVFDWNTALNDLQMSVTSSDLGIISGEGLRFSGSGSSRSLNIRPRPNATGTVTLTVRVTDGAGQFAEDSFQVIVVAVNDPPVAGSLTALDLSGGGARVETAAVPGLNPGNSAHTIEAWLKPGGLPQASYGADFNSGLPPRMTLSGSAQVADGVLKLTPNRPSQNGVAVINGFSGPDPVTRFRATFRAGVFGGGPTPADGFSFNFVPANAPANAGDFIAEDGSDAGLAVCFDTYDNGAGEAPSVEVKWLGQVIGHVAFQASTPAGVGAAFGDVARNVVIFLNASGRIDVTYGGTAIFDNLPTPYVPIAGGKWVLAARTGGLADNHWIDDLVITLPGFTPPAPGRQWPLVLGQYDTGAHHWLLQPGATPDTLQLQFGVWARQAQIGNVSIPIGQWTHLATTWDPGTSNYTLFKNGLFEAQVVVTNGVSLNTTALRLGVPLPGESQYYGLIDEVRVWNRALIEPEIAQNFRRPIPGPAPSLRLYWRFDEGEADLAANSVFGVGGHGAMTGGFAYVPGVFGEPAFRELVVVEDTPTAVFLPGYDVESWANLTFTIVTPPAHGVLTTNTGNWNPFLSGQALRNPLTYRPATNYNGADFFTYRVTDPDGAGSPIVTQYLTVLDTNDLPSISSISSLVIEEGTQSPAIPIFVSDPETPANLLTLSAILPANDLIKPDGVTFGGAQSLRFVTIRPEPGQLGQITMQISVADNYLPVPGITKTTNFTVRVVPRPAYAVFDLGTLPARLESYGNALSDAGWAVANADTESLPGKQAFLYRGFETDEPPVPLTGLSSPADSLGINRAGQITGVAGSRAFRWDNGAGTALNSSIGGSGSSASIGRAINADGQVAGAAKLNSNGKWRAALWPADAGAALDLGLLSGGDVSEAFAVNDGGAAAGYSTTNGGFERACVFVPGSAPTPVGVLPGHNNSRALGLNLDGHTVGWSATGTNTIRRAFLRDGVALRDLGLLPGYAGAEARSLNRFDQAVGTLVRPDNATRAFVYSAGVLRDLNDLLPEDTGWTLMDARAINNEGWITGWGVNSNGQRRAYLAVPAWVIGRQIARPENAVARTPQIELIGSQGLNSAENSFFWSAVEQKEYAIRPVKARFRWFTSFTDFEQSGTNFIANTNRAVVVGAAVWPRVPTRHVAGAPVEVEPQGVPFGYRWQELIYVHGTGADVDPNTKLFQANSLGYTVLRYLITGQDGIADPLTDPPAFDVVRTHFWSNAPVFAERNWFVGDTIINSNHFDYLGKNGFVFYEKAFYDGAGPERAYDRVSRQGPILPVNAATPLTGSATNQMAVVWYQTNRLGVAWGGQATRYNLEWNHSTSNKLIIASLRGSGLLSDALFPEKRVYNQPNPELPGFNPNEEHAMLAPGESGTALFALRNDLNGPTNAPPYYSAPFALLKFRDSVTSQWKLRAYRILTEETPYFFNYPGEAGKEIQPPLPLSVLPLTAESHAISGPWWEDYQGKIYARAAGSYGNHTNVLVRWFYPYQPAFWYDLNRDGTNDVVPGASLAWLDRRTGGSPGTPVDVTYDIRWPDRDNVLLIGQTLLTPAEDPYGGSLPEIQNQAQAEIVFDSLSPNDTWSVTNLARLYDPLSPRILKTNVFIPDSLKRRNLAGKEYFEELSWPLKQRLVYDPVNKWLWFEGRLDANFDSGQPLLLPNVLSSNELKRLKELAFDNPSWGALMDRLYRLCRNPNGVDLEAPPGPDDALRLGLITQYTLRSARTVTNIVSGQTTNFVGTNYVFERPSPLPAGTTVVATNVVPERFGSQAKALTAALGGVPPSAPLPFKALRFDGVNDRVATSNSFDLANQSFTIELWVKRGPLPLASGYCFSQVGAANAAQRLALGFRSDHAFEFRFGGNALAYTGPATTDTNWHHWACAFYDTTNGRAIFLDGVKVAQDTALADYGGSGPLLVGALGTSNYFKGDLDEVRVWTLGRRGSEISLNRHKRLKGAEPGLFLYYRFDEGAGNGAADASDHGLGGLLQNGPLWVDSTAPAAIPPRYVTLAVNNDPNLPGLPVTLYIVRIDDGPFIGDVKLLPGDNVFDQRVSFRHSSEFGGNPDAVQFQWYYKPDAANFNSRDLPVPNPANPDVFTDDRSWIAYTGIEPPSGYGVNDLTIGEGGESGLLVMSDSWWICRYRGFNINGDTNWSGWVGDPSGSPDEPRAKFSPGWIKRVIAGLNPFDQRVTDFRQNEVATYVSMIQQAGDRYVGDIAFNPSADYLNSIGLIAAYETVLRRGRNLSIDGVPQVNFDPANNALLLASGKIADLYMLLGNEAYGDAQDPTIGFGSTSSQYGSLSASIFAFQNQLDSLLEEELVLLRGRDDSRSGVNAPPYNRLLWNFTLGEGEIAYRQVYNIKDVTGAFDAQSREIPDGQTNERDARREYPQGHGDAWGHYLTALKKYYALLRHPYFTWVPRTENVNISGIAVEVDFLDERKFAQAASAKAKAGKEIVDLTYRQSYVEDPDGQWQGYKDTQTDRAWGVDDWARRAGVGAYFDWLTVNTILPATDPNPAHTGIQKVDRTTVTEIADIPAQLAEIQSRLDQADAGLNPLGLVKGATVFDIDPTFNAVGSTAQIGRQAVQGLGHFEQIKERAVKTLNNANRVWDEANRSSQQIRQQEDSLDQFQRAYRDREFDFKNRLIEIFGYPYAGDIGPGKTYPNGYDGPDLYRFMYVNVTEITGQNSPPYATFQGFFNRPSSAAGLHTNTFFLGFDSVGLEPGPNTVLAINYHLSAGDYGFAATAAMGKRRAQGEIQDALSDLVQANAQLKIRLQNYDGLIQDIQASLEVLEANYRVNASSILLREAKRDDVQSLNKKLLSMRRAQIGLNRVNETFTQTTDNILDGVPKFTVAGLAFGGDLFAPLRGALGVGFLLAKLGVSIAGDVLEGEQFSVDLTKENNGLQNEIDLAVNDQRFEVLQRVKALESQVRNESAARLEAYSQAEVVSQAAQKYLAAVAKGQRVIEEVLTYRRNTAAEVTERRYQDMTFRLFRNDAIQKFRAQFDMAAKYCYLAATVYDYETCFLGPDPRAGRRFLNDLIKQRALGQMVDGNPAVGAPGLADSIARLEASFEVIRGQFGINNPQLETGRLGLRHQLFRMGYPDPADPNDPADANWRAQLRKFYVPNLWTVPEFRRYCRPFAPESAGPQPALVIPFSTTITFGLNFFGWPLAGGDTAYDPTFFATKINAVGIQFDGYDAAGLSATPRVFLIPVGIDVLRSPSGDTLATREFRIFDQALPVPFPIGNSDMGNAGWIPLNDSLSGVYGEVRRFASMRAFPTEAFPDVEESEVAANTRLVGRSIWNTQWLLIIPGGTLLFDQNRGIDQFINSVTDIRLLIMSYSYAGN